MIKSNFRLVLFFAILSGLLVSAGFLIYQKTAWATEPDQAVVDDLNKQIDAQRAKIDEIAGKIEEYKKNVQVNRQETANLKNQILLLNNQIGKTDLEISLKEEQTKELQLKMDQTNIQINDTEKEIELQKEQLAGLIRLIGRYEDRDYIAVILANDSFSDFFDRLKYSTNIQKNVQKSMNKVKESGERLKGEQKRLSEQKQELSEILNKLEDTKGILGRQKNDKNQLVSTTQQSEKKFQSLINSLKKEQNASNAQVAALERKLRDELAKKGTSEKFNTLGNAALVWPTQSHRLTATYHDPTYPYRSLLGEHSGIDLGVPLRTQIKAAEAGYVAKVALGTKWYGNYIMIIHGGNITTLYAHLSSVNVKQDQYVTRGQLIGLSGSTGFSSGPHLHFEVRSNGIPVNPLNYLP